MHWDTEVLKVQLLQKNTMRASCSQRQLALWFQIDVENSWSVSECCFGSKDTHKKKRICNKICISGLNTCIAGIVFQEADKDKGDFAIFIIYVNYNMLLIRFILHI